MSNTFSAVKKNISLIWDSLKNAKKEQLTVENFKGFIQGTSRKFLEDIGYDNLAYYQKEQIIFRSLACKECTIEGKCVICKCHTPEKYYEDRACESGNYPFMLEEKEWEEYKKENKIDEEMLNKTVVKVNEPIHDFKTVKEKDVVLYDFKLKNVGLNIMQITSVTTSCGCTASNWSNLPIEIDGETIVTARFDSNGRKGNFIKTITVKGNFDEIVLKIKGVVTND